MKKIDFVEILKEKDEILLSAPIGVSLELTSKCNLKCKYCYTDAGLQQEKELSKEEILNLIDELYSLGVMELTYTGGEPLCRPEVCEIAQYAYERDFTQMLSTNGTLIDMKTASKIASAGFVAVQVSIEGNETQHDALTGVKGSYRKSLKALENLERVGIPCFVATTITSLNIEYIPFLIKKIYSETPALRIRLLRFLPMGRGENVLDFEVSTEELKKLYLKIQEIEKEMEGSFRILLAEAFNAPFFDRPSHPCVAACSWCCITPEGYVIPCNYFSSPNVLEIIKADNIREKKFIDIWKFSPLLQKFRNPINELKGRCRTCDVVRECRGGCRAVSFSYTGSLFNMSPYCGYEGG